MEIERKFLVKNSGYRQEAIGQERIVQGYLCRTPQRTVRVRIKGGRGFLTIKGESSKNGISRFEWEKEIPLNDAESLLAISEPGTIEKTRFLVSSADGVHTWEVDEFSGENAPLVVAEIELSSEDEPFCRPSWLGEEVSSDARYCNSSLSVKPFGKW